MRTYNLRLVLWLMGVFLVTAVGVHLLHGFQVRRNAGVYRELAAREDAVARDGARLQAERVTGAQNAIGHYRRYLALKPDDVAVRADYGKLLALVGDYPRAYQQLERVLREDQDNEEIRRLQIEVTTRLGLFSDAKDHLDYLVAHLDHPDAQLLETLGRIQFRLNDPQAAETLERAYQADPTRISAYKAHADLLRAQPDNLADPGAKTPEGAPDPRTPSEKVIDAMVAANPQSAHAYLTRAEYYLRERFKDPQKIKQDVDRALQLGAEDPDVLAYAAQVQLVFGEVGRARELLNKSIAIKPDIVSRYVLLIDLEQPVYRPPAPETVAAAIAVARRGLEAVPDIGLNFQLRWRLALLLQDQGNILRQQRSDKQAEVDHLRRAGGGGDADAATRELGELASRLRETEAESQQLQAVLNKERPDAPEVVMIKARQLLGDQQWFEARRLLESRRTDLSRLSPAFAAAIEQMLALCYTRLGSNDLQLQAYRRMREDDPENVSVVLNYALALTRFGRINDALSEYDELERIIERSAAASHDKSPSYQTYRVSVLKERFTPELTLARLQPASPTQFDAAARCVKVVRELSPDDPWIPVAEADLAVARGQKEQARTILSEAVAARPNDLAVHMARFNLALAQRDFADAAGMLDDMAAKFSDSLGLRLAQAELAVQRDGREGLAKLDELAAGSDNSLSKVEQSQLHVNLAVDAASVDPQHAIRFARRAVQLSPNNVLVQLLLLRLARAANDADLADESARAIQAIARSGPTMLYAQAVASVTRYVRDLAERARTETGGSAAPDAGLLTAAQGWLREAERTRPDWVELRILEGDVARLRGDSESALLHYQRAIDLGSRDLAVIRNTAVILNQLGRQAEAAAVLQHARETQQIGPEGARVIGSLALEQREFTLARDMIEIPIEWNAATSSDFTIQALSYLYEGNYAEGVAALDRALEQNAANPDLWLTKIEMLVQQAGRAKRDGHDEEFQQRVAEARQAATQGNERVDARSRPLFQARAAAILAGVADVSTREAATAQVQKLLELFAQAIQAAPRDVDTLQAAVKFYLSVPRSDVQALALPILERIASGEVTENDAARRAARRSLASALGSRPGYRAFQEAIQYSDANLGRKRDAAEPPFWPEEVKLSEEELAKAASEAREDLWVRARVLAPRALPSLQREALRILEALGAQLDEPPAGVEMLMSELYLSLGDRRQGLDRLRSIIGRAYERQQYDEYSRFVGRYIDLLLDDVETAEAATWVRRLKQMEARNNDPWIHTAIREARLAVPRTLPGRDQLPWNVADALRIVRAAVDDDNVKPPDKNVRREVAIAFLEDLLRDAVRNRTTKEQDEINQEIERNLQEFVAEGTARLAAETDEAKRATLLANLQLRRVADLARQGQRAAAVELVRDNWERATPGALIDAAAELVHVKAALRQIEESHASDAQREPLRKDVLAQAAEVEQMLTKAVNQYRGQGASGKGAEQGVMMLLAELYLGTQRYAEAISAYRDVLSSQPENVVALNNTALMLATTNPAQALEQIKIAMQLVGPLPTIVDSSAMILLANGEVKQALAAARRVIDEAPPLLDPELSRAMARQWGGFYFHLAVILDANGQTNEALRAMGEALRLGAEESDVFEPELPLWHRMLEKWNAAQAAK